MDGKPQSGTTGQIGQSFNFASMAHGSATRWADGTCMAGVDRGDPAAYRHHILNVLAEKGLVMKKGSIDRAANDGARVSYRNGDPRPLIHVLTRPDGPKSKRPAIVASLYRARGNGVGICL